MLPEQPVLYTLELPWIADPKFIAGKPDCSCVPAGTYMLMLHDTPKHPKSFALVNSTLGVIHEPDPEYPFARTACLIHIANTPQELEGCIGVGLGYTHCMISHSALALAEFNIQVPWVAGHTLSILGAPNP